jgi:MYXO-CTERM domain-containing protein
MNGMRKLAAIIITTALLGLSQVNDAYACTCLPPPPVATAVAESTAVFAGTIVAMTPPSSQIGEVVAKLSVERVWKGSTTAMEVEVHTPSSSAACGLSFMPGDKWLIYANEVDGHLSAILCSRSAPLSAAQQDLVELGPGTVPGTVPPVPPGKRGCVCDMAPDPTAPWGAALALGAAGVLAMRRRRRTVRH